MKIKCIQRLIDICRKDETPYVFKSHMNDKHIYNDLCANEIIAKELAADKPSLICRLGSVECSTAYWFYRKQRQNVTVFRDTNKHDMSYNAGFFPATDYMLSRFSSEFLEILKHIDISGVWFPRGEQALLKKYAPDSARFVYLDNLNVAKKTWDDSTDIPYTAQLKGKKVLVISPFAETIKSQYKKRELLHKNIHTLPEFELFTIKAINSIHDNIEAANLPYRNWFEALDYMRGEIDKIDFDIAILGCGAYGLFLADYCKSLGKKALHLGGVHQLLFGIKGKRFSNFWDGNYVTYNEHWVSPSLEEHPKGFEKVEGGCYW